MDSSFLVNILASTQGFAQVTFPMARYLAGGYVLCARLTCVSLAWSDERQAHDSVAIKQCLLLLPLLQLIYCITVFNSNLRRSNWAGSLSYWDGTPGYS